MPIIKRQVEPTGLGRRKIPANSANDLDTLANNTLTGCLTQLSSFANHAQDLFKELGDEANEIGTRIERLQQKAIEFGESVDRYSSAKTSDSYVVKRKNAKNSSDRVLDRHTMPEQLKKIYDDCDSPPPLHELDEFRGPHDTVQESMKLYTNPDFFFELWREKIQVSFTKFLCTTNFQRFKF